MGVFGPERRTTREEPITLRWPRFFASMRNRYRWPSAFSDLGLPGLVILGIVPLLLWSGATTRRSMADASLYQQHVREARTLRARVLTLQLDEETGVRGYTSTHERLFLEPYESAQRALPVTLDAARRSIRSIGLGTAAIDDEAAAHEQWHRTVAEPLLRSPDGPHVLRLQLAGKVLVDRIRRDDVTLRETLDTAAASSSSQMQRVVADTTDETVGVTMLVAVLAVALGFVRRRAARRISETQALYENEKRIADLLQAAFLQKDLPLSPTVGLHAAYVPATDSERVGGDWYDAFELPDGRILFSIGDVAGHGLEAAIVMSRARQAIVVAALHEDDPAAVLARANNAILLQDATMVTAICGYLDPRSMEVTYATAGHPAPVMVPPGAKAAFLPYDGIPLGIEPDAAFRTFVAHAQNGGVLVLYTDGVIEHKRNIVEGERNLLAAIDGAARAENPAVAIHQNIFHGASSRDDVAILTLSFRDIGDGRGRASIAGTQASRVDVAVPVQPG